ncbi:MAG: metallophosphoesterase [Methylacidiphilales bacterium]|nr:metallophosphoesterase [Candidatus Methylacidiphilales bacterium]
MIPRVVLILVFALVMNAGFAMLQLSLLRRRQPYSKAIARGVIIWSSLMSAFFILQVFEPEAWKGFLRRWFYFPMAVEMIWNVLLLEVLLLILILATLILHRSRPVNPSAPLDKASLTRRKFIYLTAYAAAPVTAVGLGVHGTLTQFDLRVNHLDIPIPNLPPELDGLTIAHVSDLHSGIFCGPRRLKIISDASNDLKADLVAITGDIVNRSIEEFPDAVAAMLAIESRYGSYLCEGNHDIIPGHNVIANACAKHNLPMLKYACLPVMMRGCRLLLAGIPWVDADMVTSPIVSSLFPARQKGDVRILLAHHPHLFDHAESTDLVLSGHTHGGQIMFGPVGLGPLFFRYWSGLYHRNNTTMVVSNGCGDWFPCRIGAPAEVGLLRLTTAPAQV